MSVNSRSGFVRGIIVSTLLFLAMVAIMTVLGDRTLGDTNEVRDVIRFLVAIGLFLSIGILLQAFFWPWVRDKAEQDRRTHSKESRNHFLQTLETLRQYIANEPSEPIDGPNSGARA